MADVMKFDFDVTNVEAWDGTKGGLTDLPPGAYKAKTVTAQPHVKKGNEGGAPTSYAIEVETDAGQTTIYLGLDFSKDANKRKLRTALASVGMKAAGMKGSLTPAHFLGPDGKGRPCFIIVKEVDGVDDKGRKKLNDKEFLTPEQFAAYTQTNGAAVPKANTAAAGSAAPADDVGALFT